MEERLAVVLPIALAPVVAAVQSESTPVPFPGEDDAAPWPEGAATFEVIKVGADDLPAAETAAQRPAAPDAPLPALDAMVARIPQDVREALDDLFRVKFINVQRMPASTLKD